MHRLMFEAIVFDMDGVLIQSRELIAKTWNQVAREQGVVLSAACLRDHVHGRPGSYTLHHLFGHLPLERRQALKQRVDTLEEQADCPLLPGAASLIRQLLRLKVPLALVTSSWPARIAHVLQQHQLQTAFSVVISRDDVQRGKPAPEGYCLAAKKLKLPAAHCLVFEDSLSGVQAACQAGTPCVAIGDEPSLTAEGARWSSPDFRDVHIVRESSTLYCEQKQPRASPRKVPTP